MEGVIGILLSLALLMYLAYRGISVIILAPVLAMLAVVLAGEGGQMLGIYTQIFMTKMGSFAIKYFPIFLLGAIFGKLMEDSGSAKVIAKSIINTLGIKHASLAIVLACGLLTYGGVSAFVVAFAVYPLAAALFREANLPKRFIPATIALGAFTFTMTCLPGTSQIHNIIPVSYFGTDMYAAPLVGLCAGLAMMLGGLWWINRRITTHENEGYGENHSNEPLLTEERNLPSLLVALLPIIAVVAANFIFQKLLIPSWDTSYLAAEKFGNMDVNKVKSIWSMIMALILAIATVVMFNWSKFTDVNGTMTKGAMGSMLPTFNTASEVGYGGTIASLGAFLIVKQAVINISPENPLVSEVVAVNVLAGITGSASGGLTIALEALGSTYAQLAEQFNINPEWMHRLASMASGGFDSLPHNGAVITLLTICGLSHRQSYKDIFMVSLVIPVTVTAITVAVLSLLI
ncbi:GntP family permease [Marinicella sp. S1101]|uniref:GntP family permease n=1 Tax=Marinicella marina TaxID=2996016 RepID=UPI002260B4DE|nr:GntP family permease [Marinicella marina]MCX7552477.1 GntP family permease [Marinicella marina]MDJ1139353.1 GntP family permease [Marinicella marina]